MGRTLKDDLLSDHQQTFSRTSEFGESAVYYPPDASGESARSINVTVISHGAPIVTESRVEEQQRELVVSVDSDATTGITRATLGGALALDTAPGDLYDFVAVVDEDAGAVVLKFCRNEPLTYLSGKLAGR